MMDTAFVTVYGALSTKTITTTITAHFTPTTIPLNWPSPPITRPIQYTSVASPVNPESKYLPNSIPIFIVTQIDGVVVNDVGIPLTTFTRVSKPPEYVYNAVDTTIGSDCSGWSCWSSGKQAGAIVGAVLAAFLLMMMLCCCCARVIKRKPKVDEEHGIYMKRRRQGPHTDGGGSHSRRRRRKRENQGRPRPRQRPRTRSPSRNQSRSSSYDRQPTARPPMMTSIHGRHRSGPLNMQFPNVGREVSYFLSITAVVGDGPLENARSKTSRNGS